MEKRRQIKHQQLQEQSSALAHQYQLDNGGDGQMGKKDAENGKYHEVQQQTVIQVFFDGKLHIFPEIILPSLEADVLVNFCASDILSGDEVFLNVHELAGDELKNICAHYQGIDIGSVRFTDSFGLKNLKKIAHAILPRPVQGNDDLNDLDEFVEIDLMLCYRNALDKCAEDGYHSIVFTHPMLYADRYGVARMSVAILSYWLNHSPYAHTFNRIVIACAAEVAQCYHELLTDLTTRGWDEFVSSHSNNLYTYMMEIFDTEKVSRFEIPLDQAGPSTSSQMQSNYRLMELPADYDENMADIQMLEALFEREFAPLELIEDRQSLSEGVDFSNSQQYQQQKQCSMKRKYKSDFNESEEASLPTIPNENPNLNQFCIEHYGFDEHYIREHPDEVYSILFCSPDGLQLQLSRNLSATILTIEEEQGGLLRQYRMTTQNREGETLYFRCSRCESLMRYTNDEYRPKITVKDGFINGSCYPAHHPQCYPCTKEWVILQQLDRQARLYALQMGMPPTQPFNIVPEQMEGEQPNLSGNEMNLTAETGTNTSMTVKQYLTGQQRQFTGIGEDYQLRNNSQSTNARNRLRPSAGAGINEAFADRQQQNGRVSISSVKSSPMLNMSQRSNISDMPILYRRKEESTENATLRAIRNCENELEGRVSEELDRALTENTELWKTPFARATNYMSSPLATAIGTNLFPPRRGRGRPPRYTGQFMEVGQEEMAIEDELQANAIDNEKEFQIMSASQQLDQLGIGLHPQQMTGTSGTHLLLGTGEQSQSSMDEEKTKAETEGRSKFRKFRMISKRGAKTNLAFDWREADLNGLKVKK